MRKNKKYYGLIAGVMALALATPFVGYNIAKADKSPDGFLQALLGTTSIADYDNYLVDSYDFEDGIGDAKAIVKGLGKYNGELKFVNGANGKALATDGYGLDIGNKVKGTDFTISYLVKPNKSQGENQVMMLMGYHSPEHWTAISGDGGDQTYKLWGNNAANAVLVGNAARWNTWTTVGNPSVKNGSWSIVTLVGTDGHIDMYVNGVKAASGAFNNPLCGEKESILFGANYWDACFDGAIDEIKIYNRAMDEATVKAEADEFLDNSLQASLDAACDFEEIKGKNTDKDHIRYNLELPTNVVGTAINWTSSNPEVISEKGVVTVSDKSSEVTLTATAELSGKKAIAEIDLVVDALDKSELNALIERAKAFDLTFMSADSIERLNDVIEEAEEADSFEEVDVAIEKLTNAIETLELSDEYVDPFDVIPEAEVTVSIEAGSNKDLFVLPEAILDKVTVEYTSEDADVASYEEGKVVANKVGKTIVTATVKALSDGYEMEYATAVDVTEKAPAPAPTPGTSGSGSSPDSQGSGTSSGSGSSSSAGSSASSGSGSSSSSGGSASSENAGTTTPAGGTAVTVPEPQVPAAGPVKPSTKPSAGQPTSTENEIETEEEEKEKATEEVAEPSTEEGSEDTSVEEPAAEETIEDEQVPEAAEQSTGSSATVVIVIAAAAILLAGLLFVLAKLGFLGGLFK